MTMYSSNDALDLAHRKERENLGLLVECRNEIREQYIHPRHFALEKHFASEFGNGACFAEKRRVFISKFGRELPFGARDELRALATSSDVNCRRLVEFGGFAHQIAVERAAEAF